MCARFETPSTYSGQWSAARSTSYPPASCGLEPGHERVEEGALALGERRVQILGDHLLARSVAHAPRKRLRVADRRPRVAERTRVLVDAERERRRLERAHLDLALGEDRHHRRRKRAVVRPDGILGAHPVGRLARMVVEEHHLDIGAPRNGLEFAQALRVGRLDDDEPLDAVRVDPPGLGNVELVCV